MYQKKSVLPQVDGFDVGCVETKNLLNNDLRKVHGNYTSYLFTGAQILNLLFWYWTNGMNGISMQYYAGMVEKESEQTNTIIHLIHTITTASIVTCLQLLGGAFIGRMLLFHLNRNITWHNISSTHRLLISILHGFGSESTNLGFLYGKASVIQVIKLLEPFETLILSKFIFREGNVSSGVISSMIMAVGSAMSLLKMQSKAPLPQAVISAVFSGICLSCRNVLQRKQHCSNQFLQDLKPFEKSVVQFTQISFFSGLWTGILSIVLFMSVPSYKFCIPSFQVFMWHPLYNIFSMIMLGFCSALTHSLLNAMKRVFSIVMVMLYFSEGLNVPTLASLFLAGTSGFWYSWERKIKEKERKKQSLLLHFCTVVAALSLLFWFQRMWH